MALILDVNSEHVARARKRVKNKICEKSSRMPLNRLDDRDSSLRAHPLLSYHLVSVPWCKQIRVCGAPELRIISSIRFNNSIMFSIVHLGLDQGRTIWQCPWSWRDHHEFKANIDILCICILGPLGVVNPTVRFQDLRTRFHSPS